MLTGSANGSIKVAETSIRTINAAPVGNVFAQVMLHLSPTPRICIEIDSVQLPSDFDESAGAFDISLDSSATFSVRPDLVRFERTKDKLLCKGSFTLARIHRRTGMDGVRTAEGGDRGSYRRDDPGSNLGRREVGGRSAVGAPMAACSGCGERDGGIGHGKRRSRTGLARVCGGSVCGDVGSVAEGAVRLGVEWLAAGPGRD